MPPRTDLFLSLLLHVAVGAAWWSHAAAFSTATSHPVESATTEATPLPSTPLLVVSEPHPLPDEPTIMSEPEQEPHADLPEPAGVPDPIDYLAEPSAAAEATPPKPEPSPTALAGAPAPAPLLPTTTPERSPLPPALAAEGRFEAPAYTVVGLDDRLLADLLAQECGCLLVVVGGERWIATGIWPAAMRLEPLATSPWRTRIAERMLPLPPRFAAALGPTLTRELGPAAPTASPAPALRLALTHTADAQLLAAQQAAVREAGLPWDQCAVTEGTLQIDYGTLRFHTTRLMPRP